MNKTSDSRAICPFYRSDSTFAIVCEGTKKCRWCKRFELKTEKEKYQRECCETFDYLSKCAWARMFENAWSKKDNIKSAVANKQKRVYVRKEQTKQYVQISLKEFCGGL